MKKREEVAHEMWQRLPHAYRCPDHCHRKHAGTFVVRKATRGLVFIEAAARSEVRDLREGHRAQMC